MTDDSIDGTVLKRILALAEKMHTAHILFSNGKAVFMDRSHIFLVEADVGLNLGTPFSIPTVSNSGDVPFKSRSLNVRDAVYHAELGSSLMLTSKGDARVWDSIIIPKDAVLDGPVVMTVSNIRKHRFVESGPFSVDEFLSAVRSVVPSECKRKDFLPIALHMGSSGTMAMWMPSWFDAPVCLHLSDVPASNRYMCGYSSDHIKTAVSAFDRGSDMTISLSDPSSEGMNAAPLIINGKIHGHTVSVYVAQMIFGDDGLCRDKEGVAYFRFAAMSKAEGSYEKYQSILSKKQE